MVVFSLSLLHLAVKHFNLVTVENLDIGLTELRQVLVVKLVLLVFKKTEAFAYAGAPFLFHLAAATRRAV
jgi:hypothetical protein